MIWEAAGATIDDPSGLGFLFVLVSELPTKGAWEAVSYVKIVSSATVMVIATFFLRGQFIGFRGSSRPSQSTTSGLVD